MGVRERGLPSLLSTRSESEERSRGRGRVAEARARRPSRASKLGRKRRRRRLRTRKRKLLLHLAPVCVRANSGGGSSSSRGSTRSRKTHKVDCARRAAEQTAVAAAAALAEREHAGARPAKMPCEYFAPCAPSSAHVRKIKKKKSKRTHSRIAGSSAAAAAIIAHNAPRPSLAEIVAQMRDAEGAKQLQTIALPLKRQQQQQQLDEAISRLAPIIPINILNIEDCKSRSSQSLLENRKRLRIKAGAQNSPLSLPLEHNKHPGYSSSSIDRSQITHTLDKTKKTKTKKENCGRSLDKSLRYLHERHFNGQRPPIQRLLGASGVDGSQTAWSPSPSSPSSSRQLFMTRPCGSGRSSVTTPTSGPPRACNKRQPMVITRLVPRRPVRSSGTQTAAAAAAAGAATTTATVKSSPYNTRRRFFAASQMATLANSISQRLMMNAQSGQGAGQNLEQRQQLEQQQQQQVVTPSSSRGKRLPGSSQVSLIMPLDEMEQMRTSSKAYQWHWSETDKSHECVVDEDKLGLCFHPHSSESAAACRAAKPLRRNGNHYYWEICVQDKCYGTSVMFGLCTKQQRLHANDYCNLVGLDDQGWSLSHKGLIWHNGQKTQYTSEFPHDQPVTVGLLYNTVRGELSFFMDGKNLGVAFSGLNNIQQELYPVVGSTAKCTQMRLVSSRCGYVSLLERSCFTLLESTHDRYALIEYLRQQNLPNHLLAYVAGEANVIRLEDDGNGRCRTDGGENPDQQQDPSRGRLK